MSTILKINAFDRSSAERLDPETAALLQRREAAFGRHTLLFYSKPLQFVRGSGVWLYDRNGDAYLDAYNNVPQVGHCHPHVVDAIARQASTLNIHTRYLSAVVYDYADRLLATFPDHLSNLSLTCTGTESVDLAMRVSQSFTGGTGFIVTRFAYHGNSVAVSGISPSVGEAVPVGRDVRLVPAPDGYRNPTENIAEAFASAVSVAIADMRRHGIRLAAMIVDSVFSSDGVFPDPAGFLRDAVARVHEAGGLFIADEVQPGFGRTGSHMWGFQRHDVKPDIVVMGKPMGNGIPIGAVVARPDVLEQFTGTAGYFNTFGGNPVSCAAGMAVLEVLEREGLLANARTVGEYFKQSLRSLSERHDAIGDVRGAGLFLSVEFVKDRGTREPDPIMSSRVINGMRERRVLVGGSGEFNNMLKIRPPLPFSRQNVDQFVETLNDVLEGIPA